MNIVQQVPEDEWKQFLKECNDATLYHTPEWKIFLEKTFDYKPYYLFAKDECGILIGFLPLFQVKSRLTGNRLCSLPFSHECGCLGDKITCNSLIDEAIAIKDKYKIDMIELRNNSENPNLKKINNFCTHILELSQNPEDTWKRLDRGSVRWAVNKSKKLGVSVRSSNNIEDLKEFYELNCITKQNLGVPCHPWKFFYNLFSILGDSVSLYISQSEDNKMIGSGIMEYYKDHVIYGYGAANPDHLHLHPYNAFIWKSIEDACLNGYRSYDFGRTSYESTGLINFKKKWGTQEKKLLYSFCQSTSQSVATNRNSCVYQLGNTVIRKMPMLVYKTFSNNIFWNLG